MAILSFSAGIFTTTKNTKGTKNLKIVRSAEIARNRLTLGALWNGMSQIGKWRVGGALVPYEYSSLILEKPNSPLG